MFLTNSVKLCNHSIISCVWDRCWSVNFYFTANLYHPPRLDNPLRLDRYWLKAIETYFRKLKVYIYITAGVIVITITLLPCCQKNSTIFILLESLLKDSNGFKHQSYLFFKEKILQILRYIFILQMLRYVFTGSHLNQFLWVPVINQYWLIFCCMLPWILDYLILGRFVIISASTILNLCY